MDKEFVNGMRKAGQTRGASACPYRAARRAGRVDQRA